MANTLEISSFLKYRWGKSSSDLDKCYPSTDVFLFYKSNYSWIELHRNCMTLSHLKMLS